MKWYHSYETLELNTPSRLDGVDFENEARYRKEGARFIMDLGNKLGLPYLSIASGIVFFHRFYMFHSFKEFSRWVTAPTCLFLAGKVEETPKKCRDILKVTQQALPDHRFKAFGENPREEVMIIERILLQTIKFDLQLNHPYTFLIKYGKLLKGDMEKINGFVQKAWIFINDSLSTTLCLVYKPQVIGLAVLLLSFKISNQNIRDFMSKPRPDWWKVFYPDAKEGDLEEICEVLTNMYKGKPPKKRFPNLTIDKLKASAKGPGSPAKKQKLQGDSPSTSVSSTTPTTTTSILSTMSSTISSSTIGSTTTTTSAAKSSISSTSSVPTARPQTLATASGKNGSLSINTTSSVNSTVQPMQLATPTTTKGAFSIQDAPPPIDTKPPTPKPPLPQEQSTSYIQPLQPPTPSTYPPPLPVNSQNTQVNPKIQRHEQLKGFLQHQQQQSPGHTSIQTTASSTQMHSLQRSTAQQSTAQQSPFKPNAPILDHMSSFFQSTPPSKTQQAQPQLPPPIPIKPPHSQHMQNSPGHVLQQRHHQTPQKAVMDHQTATTPQMTHTPPPQPMPGMPMLPQTLNPMPPQQPIHPPVPPNPNQPPLPQFNNYQQNPMQNFPPNTAPSFPQIPPPQIPSSFTGQPGNFMPIPPAMNQQQPSFINNTMGAPSNQNNFNNFNPPNQMLLQNRLQQPTQQQQQQQQQNMSGQHPYQHNNYY